MKTRTQSTGRANMPRKPMSRPPQRVRLVKTDYWISIQKHADVTWMPDVAALVAREATKHGVIATGIPVSEERLRIRLDTPETFRHWRGAGARVPKEALSDLRDLISSPEIIAMAREANSSPAEILRDALSRLREVMAEQVSR